MKKNNIGEKKKVYCIELGVLYNSINEASEQLNISRQSISNVCNNKIDNVKGLHFFFYINPFEI